MTRADLAVSAAATIAWAARPTTSFAYDYYPLAVGCHWGYDNASGGLHTISITGERIVLGAVTRVRHQLEGDQEYENYWTKDTAGNLFIHGAYDYDGFEISYLPPIAMVMAPLYVTKTWVTENICLYDLDGTPWGGDPIHLTRWAVTVLAEKHSQQNHHPGLPGPRRPQDAGDANVRRKV